MKFLVGITFLTLIVMHPASGQAVSPKGGTYTLDACIATALANNVDVRRSENDIERARSNKTLSFGQFLPDLSANASWSRADQDNIAFRGKDVVVSRNSYSWSVRSSLLLFNGLNNIITADRSILAMHTSEENLERRKQDVVFGVHQRYYNTLRCRQLIASARSTFDRSKQQLARIREMVAVGAAPNADAVRQEVQTGRDELAVLQAENEHINALMDLQAWLGMSVTEDFAIADAVLEQQESEMAQYRRELGDFPTLFRTALERRADYRAARLTLENMRKGVSAARANYWPSLYAFAQYSWGNIELRDFSEYDRFSYGLSLSLPIFSGFQTRVAVEQAELDRMDNDNTLRQLERTIAASLRSALNALANAEKNMEIARRTLASAREDQRIATERYAVGAGTLLDQIIANAGLTTAEADLINASYNYIIARRQLDYNIGNN